MAFQLFVIMIFVATLYAASCGDSETPAAAASYSTGPFAAFELQNSVN
jgi:hypothetical protein